MRGQFGQSSANLFGRIGKIAAQSDNGKMRIHFRRPLLKRQRFGFERRKMGNLHQPQAGKQQHGVVQMRHGFPNACQRLLRMTPEQEKTNVEQQDGDGNENLMAVFYKQILHGSFLC